MPARLSDGNLPPLGLTINVTSADGRTEKRLASDEAGPRDRPQGLSFSTSRNTGFADSGFTLNRRIDSDSADVRLLDGVVIRGADGSTRYEGRVASEPRSTGDQHTLQVNCAGWMAHARDNRVDEIYVSRDVATWSTPPLSRQVRIASVVGNPQGAIPFTSASGSLIWNVTANQQLANGETNEAWFQAPPSVLLAQAQYRGARTGAFTNFAAPVLAVTTADDGVSGSGGGGTITLDNTLRSIAVTPNARYIYVQVLVNGGAVTPSGAWQQRLAIAVYGDHGLALRDSLTAGDPQGVYASDVIRHAFGKYAPLLNTRGVQDTTYPIQHLTALDSTAYDTALAVNGAHLWGLECWDDRTVNYGPTDLTDYDWQIRTDQPGVTIDLQGQDTDQLVNGLIVRYTDALTGRDELLHPDTTAELRDDSVENPYTRAGIKRYDTLSISRPCDPAYATQIGRMSLAERNQPKAPGTINVTGHIQDRAGRWQPAHAVRAGQRIAIVNHPNDRPRLIGETSWNHDSRQLRIAVETSFQALDAFLYRQDVALAAAGLS